MSCFGSCIPSNELNKRKHCNKRLTIARLCREMLGVKRNKAHSDQENDNYNVHTLTDDIFVLVKSARCKLRHLPPKMHRGFFFGFFSTLYIYIYRSSTEKKFLSESSSSSYIT